MKKSKNVGAGPVSAQKEVIDNCPDFLKRSKQKNIECSSVHSNFNGITLIALIITVIVMLILVGVTINVALNGGLFESATKAATETQKEAEKEQLLSAVVGAMGTDGKVDSTKISLPDGFQKDDSKSTETKLVVKGKEGIYWEVNLNTAAIKEYSESSTGATTYTFTVGDLARKGLLTGDESGSLIPASDFWGEGVSEELKKSTIKKTMGGTEMTTYNVKCSDPSYSDFLDSDGSPEGKVYGIIVDEESSSIMFICMDTNSATGGATNDNYAEYENVGFTISMAK